MLNQQRKLERLDLAEIFLFDGAWSELITRQAIHKNAGRSARGAVAAGSREDRLGVGEREKGERSGRVGICVHAKAGACAGSIGTVPLFQPRRAVSEQREAE